MIRIKTENRLIIRYLISLILISGLMLPFSCQQDSDLTDSGDSSDDEVILNEEASDYIYNASDACQITLKGTSISCSCSGVSVDGTNITITSAGTYILKGTLNNGQIVVKTSDAGLVRLIFNGVNISCSNSSPVYIRKSAKTAIILADNTTNTLSDGTTYTYSSAIETEPDATLFSRSNLEIGGNGSLTVNGNYLDGIKSNDGLIIKSGTIGVTAKDNGIRGKDYLIVHDGTITVNSTGDGLKSSNDTDPEAGYVNIENGTFVITTTSGDGISAETSLKVSSGTYTITTGGGSSVKPSATISTKGMKGVVSLTIDGGTLFVNSSDDAIHSNEKVVINKGVIKISSGDDGIHANSAITINNGTINITKCYEAIESHTNTINGGDITLVASDDCFNATNGNRTEMNDGSFNYFNGGTIFATSTSGDALDSNGSMVMAGGTIIANGPNNQPNVAIDYNGTFNITGGFLVAAGPNSGNMIQGFSTSSSQYSLKLTSTSGLSSATLFHIQDASGTELVTFKPDKTYYYIIFSSPALKSGSTYSIYTGGSNSGTLTKGLYTGGNYTGGTLKKSVTISGSVTNSSF